ncbi:MAG: hypothetical protein J2P37_18655 [Ktedonobacteraceae bacterium]|nr:hypothetical protein [Ktedonobacteraceae bacterium]
MERDDDARNNEEDVRKYEMNNQRPWILVAAWFGTIALVGLLKRIMDRQRPS